MSYRRLISYLKAIIVFRRALWILKGGGKMGSGWIAHVKDILQIEKGKAMRKFDNVVEIEIFPKISSGWKIAYVQNSVFGLFSYKLKLIPHVA